MHGGKELVREEAGTVNKDRVKGTMNEIAGRAKRQVGEWTGDRNAQMEGLAQEVKGKAQKTWGEVKDSVRSATEEAREALHRSETEERHDKHAHSSREHE